LLNLTAAFFVTLGTIVDIGVWYYVKDLKIFDEEDEKNSEQITKKEDVTRY
jgi:hypothetical protein